METCLHRYVWVVGLLNACVHGCMWMMAGYGYVCRCITCSRWPSALPLLGKTNKKIQHIIRVYVIFGTFLAFYIDTKHPFFMNYILSTYNSCIPMHKHNCTCHALYYAVETWTIPSKAFSHRQQNCKTILIFLHTVCMLPFNTTVTNTQHIATVSLSIKTVLPCLKFILIIIWHIWENLPTGKVQWVSLHHVVTHKIRIML